MKDLIILNFLNNSLNIYKINSKLAEDSESLEEFIYSKLGYDSNINYMIADSPVKIMYHKNKEETITKLKEHLITSVDVKVVANSLKISITEDDVIKVINHYPIALNNDPTGLWSQIIEQCFYDLDLVK